MRFTLACFALAAVAAPVTPVVAEAEQPAPPAMLDGDLHHLAFEPTSPHVAGAVAWIAVGADAQIDVPSELGVGHGPFYRVYSPDAQLSARADAGLTVLRGAGVHVRCDKAGVFALEVTAVRPGGAAITDTAHVGCATPTRFVAEVDAGAYLAGASALYPLLSWFGKTPAGDDIQLAGTLPVAPAPGETALAMDGRRVLARRAAHAPALASAGLVAHLPIDIVDASTWTLALATAVHPHGTQVSARLETADHQPLHGAVDCAVTRSHAGHDTTTRAEFCELAVQPSEVDRVCMTIAGKTACTTALR